MKKLTITSKNISQKQWSNLVLELNLLKKQWKPYADIQLEAPGIKKIIAWGTSNYDSKIRRVVDIIILQDGLYQLIPVTKAMFAGAVRPEIVDCLIMCDIV